MTARFISVGLAFIYVVFVSVSAFAQTTGATLQGTVADDQGGVLPGANITIRNTDTGWTRDVVSDERGWYRVAALPPGPYEVKVAMSGFVEYLRTGLVLNIGQEATVNHALKLATVSESITVTGQSPLVETTSNTLSKTITRTELDTLPLSGRNFSNLAAMSPGVAMVGNSNNNVLAAGQTNRSNSFLIDGTSNDDTTVATSRGGFSLEAVREFAVMANQFNAEYGMASGAIVSVVTRSGTNDMQGRAFLFHRDDSFDAQDPFSKAQGSGKSPFSQQRYGGFLGGPLVRDRFHYFGSFEGLRESSTNVITSTLVPAGQREEAATSNGDQYFFKTDYRFNGNHSLTARYRADDRISTGNGIGGLNTRERGSNTSGIDQDVVTSVTSVLSNRALNEVRVQYAKRESFTDTEGYSTDGMPQINRPSGNFGKNQANPQGRNENRLQIVENFSYSLNSHNFKLGADVSIIRADSFFPRNRDGNFTFTTDAPFDPNNLATYPTQYVVATLDPTVDLPNDLYSFFAQDQWQLRTNLTLNLGLRYDRETGFSKITDVPDDSNNFQPRLGVVWDPFKDGKTAIRGGYGHYVDQSFLNIQLNVASAKGAVETVIVNPGYPDPYSRGSTTATPPSITTITPNPKTPETRTASVGVKREVFPGYAVSVDGVYSRGYNQYAWRDLNYPDPVTGLRPDRTMGRITEYADYGNSWHRALLVGLEGRRGATVNWNASYTFSKSERDVEGFQFTAQDMNNLAADKGLATNDRRHQFIANVTYQMPWGFQIGAVAQARSGNPWNVTTGTDNNRDTFTNPLADRPDLAVPDGDPFDRNTYNANFTGRSGNLPRNFATGPGYFRLDARVSKFINIQAIRIEAFAEGFNLTNEVNFGTPQGNLRSATFGKSSQIVGNMRQVELGFRLNF